MRIKYKMWITCCGSLATFQCSGVVSSVGTKQKGHVAVCYQRLVKVLLLVIFRNS